MNVALDLNADVGEHDDVVPADDLALLSVITSANIACGGHAGNARSMRLLVEACASRGVRIGAHPSYPDREGFGRRALPLSPAQVLETVRTQVLALHETTRALGVRLAHVKPHGALYHAAWHDDGVARAVAEAAASVDERVLVFTPPGSALAHAAATAGLQAVPEGFLDRAYEANATLTPRDRPDAVLADVPQACARAVSWARTGHVAARTGEPLSLPVRTFCVHADTPGAGALVAAVRSALEDEGFRISPP